MGCGETGTFINANPAKQTVLQDPRYKTLDPRVYNRSLAFLALVGRRRRAVAVALVAIVVIVVATR